MTALPWAVLELIHKVMDMSLHRFNVATVQFVVFDDSEEHQVEWLRTETRKGVSINKY